MRNLWQAQLVMKGCTNWMEKLVVAVYQDVPNFGQREHQVCDFSPFAFQFRVALVGFIYTGKGPDVQSGKLILHTVGRVETGDVSPMVRMLVSGIPDTKRNTSKYNTEPRKY